MEGSARAELLHDEATIEKNILKIWKANTSRKHFSEDADPCGGGTTNKLSMLMMLLNALVAASVCHHLL